MKTRDARGGVTMAAIAILVLSAIGCSDSADDKAPAKRYIGSGTADWVGPPASLDAMLAASDVVVVGRVVGIDGIEDIYPDGYSTPRPGEQVTSDPRLPFTDFVIAVEEVLKGDPGERPLLRLTGDHIHSDGFYELPKPEFGQRRLFFLSRDANREGIWHSGGAWGMMFDNGGQVAWPFLADTEEHLPRPVRYFPGMDLDAAIAATRDAIRKETSTPEAASTP